MLGQETCSCSDAYRSVIDDLTIEINQLKRRLQKYERLHCSPLQQEKLFEVRIHGLPAHKKPKLEQALREIAASLDEPGAAEHSGCFHGQLTHENLDSGRAADLNPIPIDSAYASASVSDNTHNTRAKPQNTQPWAGTLSSHAYQTRTGPYLRDTPICFMPSCSPDVSEDTKKHMVVERLEHIFTGKSAASDQPDFSRQQQEISHSAAIGDQGAAGIPSSKTRLEGAREARILATSMDGLLEQVADQDNQSSRPSISPGVGEDSSPRQRPTRPMDLDMHQAQDGVDNMKYIRHLGLGSPVHRPGSSDAADGWIFLNLLMNMAQLHTFNVTPDFVRKAVVEVSSKFELSSDGHQVRWRGGMQTVADSSGSGQVIAHGENTIKFTNKNDSPEASMFTRGVPPTKPSQSYLKSSAPDLRYKARVVRGRWFSNHQVSDPGASSESVASTTDRSKISFAPAHDSPSSSTQVGNDGGSLIFYNKANFWTDLSGSTKDTSCDTVHYTRCSDQPIGKENKNSHTRRPIQAFQKRSSLSQFAKPAGDSRSNTPTEAELNFPDIDSLSLDPGQAKSSPIELEVSGLSGIQPEDNFLVDVKIQHTASAGDNQNPGKFARILSARKTDLKPSLLPPPSYICPPFSSSESSVSDSDTDSDNSESSVGVQDGSWRFDSEMLPTGHIQQPTPSGGAIRESYRNQPVIQKPDNSNGSSIDLLSYGRSFDPMTLPVQDSMDADGLASGIANDAQQRGKGDTTHEARMKKRNPSIADSMNVDASSSSSDQEDVAWMKDV